LPKITTRSIAGLTEPGQSLADDQIKGFIARKQPGSVGGISFGYRFRINGKQRWLSFGTLGKLTADQARTLAKQASAAVAAGRDPCVERATAKAAAVNTLGGVIDSYLRLYARPMGLRSARRIEQNLDRLVRPKLGARSIYDLRRSDLVQLHDEIAADTHGWRRRPFPNYSAFSAGTPFAMTSSHPRSPLD
jgi:hypothetical protein